VALRAIGLTPGDEVITAANSFIATAEAIVLAGGTPVLVDVEPDSFNLDPELVAAAVTARTRAIIPVHLYGQPADLRPILDLAGDRMYVIEDAAQAHGAVYAGRRVGSLGTLGCFSFYPTKNLGAFGDAGAMVTDDPKLATRLRMLRDHGGLTADEHEVIGQNSRMDALQAAVLSVKLPHLDSWNARRRERAAAYEERLSGLGPDRLVLPSAVGDHIFHIYVTRVPGGRRDSLLRFLRSRGVGAGVHYPGPIHRTKAFAHLGLNGKLPVAERLDEEILSLPMHAELALEDIDYVCEQIVQGLERG
jgi:dTDP-4-amino-4,6-dideoxygalactose transaminase